MRLRWQKGSGSDITNACLNGRSARVVPGETARRVSEDPLSCISAGLVVLTAVLSFSSAAADELRLGLGERVSVGRSTWEWGGPVDGNRYGVARADDTLTLMTEATVEAEWRRILLSFALALGRTVDGEHTVASANSYNLEARSDLTGDALEARLAVGYRLLQTRRLTIDGLVGAEYRRQHFEASGAQGAVLGTLSRTSAGIPDGHLAATTTTAWVSPFLEVRGRYRVTDDLELAGAARGIPWTWTSVEMRWPSREDLDQPRSLNGETAGGWGVAGSLELAYRLVAGLTLRLGVQASYLQSGGEYDFHYNVTTPDCRQPRCQPVRFELRATTRSWGPYFGLEYRW